MKSSKRKSVLFVMLALVMLLLNGLMVFAAEKTELTSEEILAEVNAYLDQHPQVIDLEEQIVKQQIPLSNGESVTITHELKKVSSQSSTRELFVGKLGTWDCISTMNMSGKGSITVTTTINVTHIPDMSSSEVDLIQFTAYNGRVEAIPFQYMAISGTSASTKTELENLWYKTTGYVGFTSPDFNINYYYTQSLSFVDNFSEDRDKISITLTVTP